MAAITEKKINLDFIREYCSKDEEKKAWYQEQVTGMYPRNVYPTGADGKPDKTQAPTVELHRITFIQLKNAFIKKYFPDLKQPKPKKASMYDPL